VKRPKKDPAREDRIDNEAIVDARPEEQAIELVLLPERQTQFPIPGEVYYH
jgi:hypothetical protein